MAEIWLADFAAAPPRGWRAVWRRWRPRRLHIGETAAGESVRLLELPWAEAEFALLAAKKRRRWLLRHIKSLRRPREELRLGLPLALAELLAAAYPAELAAARRLAVGEFVRRLAGERGGPAGLAVGVLALDEAWQEEFAAALLAAGARPALQGALAADIAAKWWAKGVALPVLSARRLLQSSDIVLLPRAGLLPGEARPPRLAAFSEPLVYVPGRFGGKYAFNMFPAGLAAALLAKG